MDIIKGIKFLLQTQIFLSVYLCNPMLQTFDILNDVSC